MKIIACLQISNASDCIEPLLKQYVQMGVDEMIILLDQNSDDSHEVIKRLQKEYPGFISEVFDATPYKSAMMEGINMAILMNLARKRGADWIVHGGRNYRWVGPLKKFRGMLEDADKRGITHILIKYFSIWKKGRDGKYYYRVDGQYEPGKKLPWCGIHKLQRDTWFSMSISHEMHPHASKECMGLLLGFTYKHIGNLDIRNRAEREKRYRERGKCDPSNYVHMLDSDDKVLLKEYDENAMIPKSAEEFWSDTRTKSVRGDMV